MRKSNAVFLVLALQVVILAVLMVSAQVGVYRSGAHLQQEQALVQQLMLTDLALFTEARYTRHLSQADLNTPFQDFPMALEHFPSGSFVMTRKDHYRRCP